MWPHDQETRPHVPVRLQGMPQMHLGVSPRPVCGRPPGSPCQAYCPLPRGTEGIKEGEDPVMVALEASTPCLLCGYRHRVIRFSDVRVNKYSLRERGVSLVSAGAHFCPECGERNAGELVPVSAYRLAPEDAVKVAEYRARRWPELAREAAMREVA